MMPLFHQKSPRDGLSRLLLSLAMIGILPQASIAHSKGIYKTEAAALEQAKKLGCEGAHQNNGAWMPCRDEAELHRAQRKQ
jgi:hypothetical protein